MNRMSTKTTLFLSQKISLLLIVNLFIHYNSFAQSEVWNSMEQELVKEGIIHEPIGFSTPTSYERTFILHAYTLNRTLGGILKNIENQENKTRKFEAIVSAANKIHLSWNIISEENITHFEVYRSKDKKHWQLINAMDVNGQKAYEMEDLLASTGTYYYQLKLKDEGGNRSFSKIVSAKVEGNGQLQVFTHPNTKRISVKADLTQKNMMLQVFDRNGQLKSEQLLTSNEAQLDFDDLPNGKYTIRVFNGQQMESASFVKNGR